jgi:hypothetical protein
MARASKETMQIRALEKQIEDMQKEFTEEVDKMRMELIAAVAEFTAEVFALRASISELPAPKKSVSINKVESFNGEVEPIKEENLKMQYNDKIQSMRNAIKILPPNLIENGRHSARNIGAICGFIVHDDMVDEVYETFTHEVA